MEREAAFKALEAILFVADAPVTLEDFHKVLEHFSVDEIRELLKELDARYGGRGIQVVEIAEGFQFRTRPELGEVVKRFHKLNHSTKLSQAALETLSIIAYRQPITRQEIEDIRGVDCSGVIKTLLDRNLLKAFGRKKVAGRPVTFGTTKKFLEYFGLVKLTDLPTLRDLPGDEAAVLQEALQFNPPQGAIADEEFEGEPEPAEEDYDAIIDGEDAEADEMKTEKAEKTVSDEDDSDGKN
ncbi:MAG: SMC-Scp complex subunit ScpB [Nitrospinae bacterium]|nr:SMC-Scp complex subunit ScpB [Nitrospinota bacterium]